jgi:hypothetical protein
MRRESGGSLVPFAVGGLREEEATPRFFPYYRWGSLEVSGRRRRWDVPQLSRTVWTVVIVLDQHISAVQRSIQQPRFSGERDLSYKEIWTVSCK